MPATIIAILLYIDGVIYNLISYVYDIFAFLAKLNIFSGTVYNDIVSRVYVVLGVVMLFVLAYSLLKAVVNPENFSKGEQSFPKLVQNVVISLIIIAVLPTVFSVAFNIQNSLLNQETIPKLVLGKDWSDELGSNPGHDLAYNAFSSFFHPDEQYCTDNGYTISTDTGYADCIATIGDNGWIGFRGFTKLSEVDQQVKNGTTFTAYSGFSEGVRDHDIDYMMVISTIAGLLILYVLVNFCFDMAIRVIKLMFFQIIAPIPVVCRILPGGKMKDVFPDWIKKTISTFVEVFIRIFVLYLGIFLINEVIREFPSIPDGGLTFTQLMIAKALLIMGVIIFIRQAPKLIGDMFHLDSGSMKLGIMDKLAMGGALTAAGAAGAMITQGGRNAVTATQKFKNAKGFLGKTGAAIGGVGSTLTGGLSAGVRAGWAGKGAKNFKDVKSAAATGTQGASAAKDKRAAYIKYHSSKVAGGAGALQTGATVVKGMLEDAETSYKEFWGIGDSAGLSDLQKEQAVYKEGLSFKKNLFDLVSDDSTVRQYTGLLKSAQEMDLDSYAVANNISRSEALAIQRERLDKYDAAIKIASVAAIQKKLEDPNDERARNIYKLFDTYKKQHSDLDAVASLNLTGLTDIEVKNINDALLSDDLTAIKSVKKALDDRAGTVMNIDNVFKSQNSRVEGIINTKIQEKKAEGK